MPKAAFVTLIFRGKRFNDGAMPLEALPELAAYRELVLAVAKSIHQASHPQRQRLPKGFEAGFRLVLGRVDAGSAIPEIARFTDPTAQPSLFPDVFDQARDLIEQAIAAAAADAPPPTGLSRDLLARFNGFGRTLLEDESIVVGPPGQRDGAIYDRGVRRRLILQANATYEDEVDLVGEVRAADKDAEGFTLRTADGRKLDVRTAPHVWPNALRSLGDGALVRVRGSGIYDADSVLVKVTMATDVSPMEEGEEQSRPGCRVPVDDQLASLQALLPGWYDAESPGYDANSLGWLAKLLTALLDTFALPRPYIYPTPDGLARAEWPGHAWEIAANFDLVRHSVEALAIRLDGDEQHEINVPLSEPGGESKLGQFLNKHLTAQS